MSLDIDGGRAKAKADPAISAVVSLLTSWGAFGANRACLPRPVTNARGILKLSVQNAPSLKNISHRATLAIAIDQ